MVELHLSCTEPELELMIMEVEVKLQSGSSLASAPIMQANRDTRVTRKICLARKTRDEINASRMAQVKPT